MPSRFSPYSRPAPEIISMILASLAHYHFLSKGLQKAFTDKIFNVQLEKGDHLVKPGEYSHYLYFLIQGVVTGYRLKGPEKLITFISVDGDFISSIEGMYGLTPADEYMIAAENCYLVAIRSSDLLDFFNVFPEMNIIMRKILEGYYKCAHERAVISRMGTAKEKYVYYLKTLPAHEDKVSAELVANFLDMKIETLLKIKKSLKAHNTPVVNIADLSALMQAMCKDQLFQQKGISLQDVANHLNIKSHQLSYLLNDHHQQSFPDFINTHRINFIKGQLKSKINFQRTTIEALGDQAGFSSKSTFFSAFKKQTGLSPLVYANNCLELTDSQS